MALIDLLMGLCRGAVFRHGVGAQKQPIKLPTEMPTSTMAFMGRFPSLMGRFLTLMGRFADFVLRGRFASWKSTGKQPIKRRGVKRLLRLAWNIQYRLQFSIFCVIICSCFRSFMAFLSTWHAPGLCAPSTKIALARAKLCFIFQGEGGVYILQPPAAGFLYAPPLFYTPPTPRRVFSGVGGGCIKFGPSVLALFIISKKCNHKGLGIYFLLSAFIFGIFGTLISIF